MIACLVLPTVFEHTQTESIHQSLANKELLPTEHLVDAGYVDATLLVESKQQYDLELMGPVRENVATQTPLSKNLNFYCTTN